MGVYFYLSAPINDDGISYKIEIPVKFRDFEQYEEMDAYAYDTKIDILNDWIKHNINKDWYIDDEVSCTGLVFDPEILTNYVDFSNQ